MGSKRLGLDWAHICVPRDNLQRVANLTCVPCNGFSLVFKWNWRWKACQYTLKKFSLKFVKHVLRMFNLKRTLLNGAVSQFSDSVMSDSLQPHGLPHTRLPCPSPTPRCYANSCPWVSDAIQPSHLCRPLLLPPSIFHSIRVFSNKLVLHIRWAKYWSFRFSISPSNEYLGLITIRID